MPTRLVIAYLLILLLIAAGAAVVWWNVHHSQHRTDARLKARQRAKAATRMAQTDQKDRNG